MKADDTYLTDNLDLAAYLLCQQQPLLGTRASTRTTRDGHTIVLFAFTLTPALGILVSEFWKNSLVHVQTFTSAHAQLRSLLRENHDATT